jgi:hypothetical protein
MPDQYIPRMVNFETRDFRIVKDCVLEYGLGDKGFSAAVRLIIREWAFYHRVIHTNLESLNPGLILQLPDQSEDQT